MLGTWNARARCGVVAPAGAALVPVGTSDYYTAFPKITLRALARVEAAISDRAQQVQQLQRAQQLQARGQFQQAEAILRRLIDDDPCCREALESLVVICLQTDRHVEALQVLRQLVVRYPDEPLYCDRLATLQERLGDGEAAVQSYLDFLTRQPAASDSRYNFARLLRRLDRSAEALEQYQRCLESGVSDPAEVHTNISVIHGEQHRHAAAEASLKQALALAPDYAPAIYNLALLREERGDWPGARTLFLQLLEREPDHVDAMVHLAHGERFTDPADPLVRNMVRKLRRDGIDALARESLHYALGKVYDECGDFQAAFAELERANELSRRRVGDYDAAGQERLVDAIITAFAPGSSWLPAPVSDAAPVFICGMFRSGSTLLEQVLGAHPALQTGGELDYFPRHIARLDTAYPAGMSNLSADELTALGQGYLDYLSGVFPEGGIVINKRPDNLLYLGLIRALFPNARFLHTLRNPLDNCLSVYFQPLASALGYANRLEDIGHYYRQNQRLLAFWRDCFAGNIVDVPYESLTASPRETVEPVLAFLGLDWHEDCLEFYRSDTRVRTASVHQVRQPVHARSAGRWRNYRSQLALLRNYFDAGET